MGYSVEEISTSESFETHSVIQCCCSSRCCNVSVFCGENFQCPISQQKKKCKTVEKGNNVNVQEFNSGDTNLIVKKNQDI